MSATLIDEVAVTKNASRNIRKTVLSNGLLVLTESMPHVRSVSMGAWVGSGSRDETARGERDLALCRAHGVQGHDLAVGAADCPGGGHDRGQPRRVYRQGDGLLQHQGPGRERAAGAGCAVGPGAAPDLCAGGC